MNDVYPQVVGEDEKPDHILDKLKYIQEHPKHDSQGWGGAWTYAREVKVWFIRFPSEVVREAALAMIIPESDDLERPGWYAYLEEIAIPQFEKVNPGYSVRQGGRSGGWFELVTHDGRALNNVSDLMGRLQGLRRDEVLEYYEDIEEMFDLLWNFDQWVRETVELFVDVAAEAVAEDEREGRPPQVWDKDDYDQITTIQGD